MKDPALFSMMFAAILTNAFKDNNAGFKVCFCLDVNFLHFEEAEGKKWEISVLGIIGCTQDRKSCGQT